MKKAIFLLFILSVLSAFSQIHLNSGLNAFYALNGCRNTATAQVKVISDCWVSLRENTLPEIEVMVYPNPTSGKITLVSNVDGEIELNLFDARGKLLHTRTSSPFDNEIIDLTGFSEGVYFLRLTSSKKLQTIKLVKE